MKVLEYICPRVTDVFDKSTIFEGKILEKRIKGKMEVFDGNTTNKTHFIQR